MGLYDIINGIDDRFLIKEELATYIITYKEDNGDEKTSRTSGTSEGDAKSRFMKSKQGRDIRVVSVVKDSEDTIDESVGDQDPNKIHSMVKQFLDSVPGLEDVKDFPSFPNKYGDDVSDFSAKYNVNDRYNYDKMTFKIEYGTGRVFIPDVGYLPFSTVDDIKKILKTNFGKVFGGIREGNYTSNLDGGMGQPKVPHAFQQNKPSASDKKKERENATSSTGRTIAQKSTRNTIRKESYESRRDDLFTRAEKLIDQLDEISYKDYSQDESMSAKKKINTSIKEVNRRLYEIDRMVTHAMKLKTETGMEDVFWKSTKSKFAKISERMLRIGNKLREFNK